MSKVQDQQKRIEELEKENEALRRLLVKVDPILGTGKVKRTTLDA